MKEIETVRKPESHSTVKLNIIIKDEKEVIKEAKKDKLDLVLWTDWSKLDQGQSAAAVSWEDKLAAKWKKRNIFLGQNKEILNTKLWKI